MCTLRVMREISGAKGLPTEAKLCIVPAGPSGGSFEEIGS